VSAEAPTPKEELEFLGRLRLLLADGAFVSTYKFALLRAIADECVERAETLGPLAISIEQLGERFVALYWRQARPYRPGAEAQAVVEGQLLQNTGAQAGVLKLVAAEQRSTPLLSDLQRDALAWGRLKGSVAQVVKRMPLYRLQTVAGQKLEFLYPERPAEDHITLNPGVAWLFRKYHDLARDLIEVAWIRFIQALPRNAELLGQGQELGQFLFGADRRALARVADVLHGQQGGRCFYCDRPIQGALHVDHFIPWSRYALDLGHNFVLSDAACNLDKRTWLPAARHLSSWVERNLTEGPALQTAMLPTGMASNVLTTLGVAQWAYSVDFAAGAATWVGKTRRVEPASQACIMIVAEGIRSAREALVQH
jgi:5-methylcytosine-specific restriction endonuclease McrA